jgi:hypothetical protein
MAFSNQKEAEAITIKHIHKSVLNKNAFLMKIDANRQICTYSNQNIVLPHI